MNDIIKKHVKIDFFGQMKIETEFGVIHECDINSAIVCKFISYLVLNRHSLISDDALSAVIWPQGVENPYGSLRGLACRTKKILKKAFPKESFITASHGSYFISPTFSVVCDTELLDNRINIMVTEKADNESEKSIQDDLNFLDLHCGAFMDSLSSDIWGLQVGAYYNSRMLSYLDSVLDLLFSQQRFNDVITYATKGLAIEPLSETLHEKIIKSLLSQGNRKMASDYYKNVINAFMREYNIRPSENFTALKKLITYPQTNIL